MTAPSMFTTNKRTVYMGLSRNKGPLDAVVLFVYLLTYDFMVHCRLCCFNGLVIVPLFCNKTWVIYVMCVWTDWFVHVLFVCLFVCLLVCLFACLLACLLVCLFACLLVCLFVCLFIC